MSRSDVIREYHESTVALKRREAEELSKLEGVRDADVRAAKVACAIPDEMIQRHVQAAIAFDEMRAALEERMIAAHEALGLARLTGQEVN